MTPNLFTPTFDPKNRDSWPWVISPRRRARDGREFEFVVDCKSYLCVQFVTGADHEGNETMGRRMPVSWAFLEDSEAI